MVKELAVVVKVVMIGARECPCDNVPGAEAMDTFGHVPMAGKMWVHPN